MLRALGIVPIPVTLLVMSLLAPTELSLFLGSIRLPPHRIVLIVLFPFAVYRLLAHPRTRLRSFDLLFLLFALVTMDVFIEHDGKDGFIFGGSLALESLGGYLIARAYIRSPAMLIEVARVVLVAVAIAALIALPEFLLGQNFAHDALRSLTGYNHPVEVQKRLGLTRAYGTFDHPIHYGTFCAAMLALIWYATPPGRQRYMRGSLLSGAAFMGLSSAPLLGIILQAVMIVWDRLTRKIRSRLALTLTGMVGLWAGVAMISDRSVFAIIATRLTLEPSTGYYRLLIYEHGLKNIWANPWYGIGLADWERPAFMVASTIDSYWLVLTMRQGIPSLLILLLAIGILMYQASANAKCNINPAATPLLKGWTMSVLALCLVGFTVHYWNVVHTFLFFVIGMGAVMADPDRRRIQRKTRTERTQTARAKGHRPPNSDTLPQPAMRARARNAQDPARVRAADQVPATAPSRYEDRPGQRPQAHQREQPARQERPTLSLTPPPLPADMQSQG